MLILKQMVKFICHIYKFNMYGKTSWRVWKIRRYRKWGLECTQAGPHKYNDTINNGGIPQILSSLDWVILQKMIILKMNLKLNHNIISEPLTLAIQIETGYCNKVKIKK